MWDFCDGFIVLFFTIRRVIGANLYIRVMRVLQPTPKYCEGGFEIDTYINVYAVLSIDGPLRESGIVFHGYE